MITYIHNEERQIGDNTYVWFIGNCLSTDVKPTELVYATSKLFELDTFKSFIFNGTEWLPVSSGGGLGNQELFDILKNVFCVDMVYSANGEISDNTVLNHTFNQITNSLYSCILVVFGDGTTKVFTLNQFGYNGNKYFVVYTNKLYQPYTFVADTETDFLSFHDISGDETGK